MIAERFALEVQVRDTVIVQTSRTRAARVDRTDPSTPLWEVRLYLEGSGLPFVRRVTYRLHETFPNPVRAVERTLQNPTCELTIWTWGVFSVGVQIEDTRGALHELSHTLTYGEEVRTLGPKELIDAKPHTSTARFDIGR